MKISKEQQEIINLSHGWQACLAPAGTGKTEILSVRVSKALKAGHSPKSMLCLTFTNRAASEMKSRIEAEVVEITNDIFIGNIHSFAHKFLRKVHAFLPHESLMDDTTAQTINRRVQHEVRKKVFGFTGPMKWYDFLKTLPEFISGEPLKVIVDSYSGSFKGLIGLEVPDDIELRIDPSEKPSRRQYATDDDGYSQFLAALCAFASKFEPKTVHICTPNCPDYSRQAV